MPRPLRFKADTSCRDVTVRGSTRVGEGIPCSPPKVFTQLHRALWRCAATLRTVRVGMQGIVARQSGRGMRSIRYTVTRLLVLHVKSGERAEASFDDFARLLEPTDVVVVNDAATIPGSVFGATLDSEPFELRLLSLPDARGEADAAVLGAGDWRTPTEKRAAPPAISAGSSLLVCGLRARVVRAEGRRVRVAFEGDRDEAVARLYRAGKPVQYAHIAERLPLWDV